MTTPRDDIAGRETHTVHDPFLKRDVEVSSKLPDRLRGKYAKGPTMPDGEPEFGWSQFETPPIQHEAADALDVAATQLDSLLKERFKLITDLADMKSRAISAEQERDALQARVKELEDGRNFWKSERDRIKAFLSEGDWQTVESEQAWRNRALRAEQERDEAYERLKPMSEVVLPWGNVGSGMVSADAVLAARDLVRRLAGPEKDGK